MDMCHSTSFALEFMARGTWYEEVSLPHCHTMKIVFPARKHAYLLQLIVASSNCMPGSFTSGNPARGLGSGLDAAGALGKPQLVLVVGLLSTIIESCLKIASDWLFVEQSSIECRK